MSSKKNKPSLKTQDEWLALGVSRTVYSLPYPQARSVLSSALSCVEEMLARHDRPWERRQDPMHEGFGRAWTHFAGQAGFEMGGSEDWLFYPCNGASEAIRETLAIMRTRGEGLVVFEGEYEGYEAMARALGMEVRAVKRSRWRDELPKAWSEGFELFVSNPSAIDGRHWGEFHACCELAEERGGVVHLDATYVGACAMAQPIDASIPAVKSVFFSLSKVFGVYYRRVGGCFSRRPNPLLEPNIWFKNLDSMWIGERLMSAFEPGALPRFWEPLRTRVLAELSERNGWSLKPCDVFMLARAEALEIPELCRAAGFPARVCATPALAAAMEREVAGLAQGGGHG